MNMNVLERKLRARKLARLYGIATTLVLSVYFSAGFFLHPTFLISDIREKIHVFADTVTVVARVLAPPVQPVVTATGMCVSGGPAIKLDWADDDNSTSYDIARDSLPLTTGVVLSTYTDTTVTLGQTASYVVTARGPMGPGFNDSDPVSATAPTECEPDIVPSIEVQTVAGKNIIGTTERHFTTDRNPRFTGVTNLAGARIDIVAQSDQETVSARVYANANGYFEWSYGGKLDFDTYTVVFTATDIADASLEASQSVKIGIEKEEVNPQNKPKETSVVSEVSENVIETSGAIDFSLTLSGTDFYAGDTLGATLTLQSFSPDLRGSQATVSFLILDGAGKVVNQESEAIRIESGASLQHVFRVPYGMAGKEYRLIAEIKTQAYRSIQEVSFRVLELPLFRLGGETVTYEQAVSQIGWISFVLLTLFFWWLLLFLREYYLYSQSLRYIAAKDLHQAGYF